MVKPDAGRRLPPLTALRAFEAAARHLSFKRAADELHVTPAAVSQQVKTLEDWCGRPLFRRLTRALALTEAGAAALPGLSDGFDRLDEAASGLKVDTDGGILTVSVPPAFGAKWLLPRLGRFRGAHPAFDVRIDATELLADFAGDGVDLAIRYGSGGYAGLDEVRLMEDVAFPVCSPDLLRDGPPLQAPDDLKAHTLLHVDWRTLRETAPSWEMWLRAAGVAGVDPRRGLRFTAETMAVQAAIDGQGVALAAAAIVADDLAAGRLVRPFPPSDGERTIFCYYVVCPPRNLRDPKVQAFRDWVLAAAEARPG